MAFVSCWNEKAIVSETEAAPDQLKIPLDKLPRIWWNDFTKKWIVKWAYKLRWFHGKLRSDKFHDFFFRIDHGNLGQSTMQDYLWKHCPSWYYWLYALRRKERKRFLQCKYLLRFDIYFQQYIILGQECSIHWINWNKKLKLKTNFFVDDISTLLYTLKKTTRKLFSPAEKKNFFVPPIKSWN